MASRWIPLVLCAIVLAGCGDDKPEPLTHEEAGRVALKAPDLLADALADPYEHGLSESSGTVTFGYDIYGTFQPGQDVPYRVVWGRDSVVRAGGIVQTGATAYTAVVYCVEPGHALLQLDETTYETRTRLHDPDACGIGEDPPALATLLSGEDLRAWKLNTSAPLPDGGVRADFDGEHGRTYHVRIDTRGRITAAAHVEDDHGHRATYTFGYGNRERIEVPGVDDRLPADVSAPSTFADGAKNFAVRFTDQQPLRSEMELRVDDPNARQRVATLNLATDGASEGGFTLRYDDADGNGRVSAGDNITVSNPEWDFELDYDVYLYDAWAGHRIGERVLPGPGLVFLLAGLLGGGVAYRHAASRCGRNSA